MHLARTLTIRRTFANHCTGNDQSRFILTLLGLGNRTIHHIYIVTVHWSDNIPAVGFKTFTCIVGEPIDDFAVNGNAIVIVNNDELIEFPCTC